MITLPSLDCTVFFLDAAESGACSTADFLLIIRVADPAHPASGGRKRSAPFSGLSRTRRNVMPDMVQDALNGLSEALVERARRAKSLVAGITVHGRSMRSGTLWRKDI